MDRGRMTSRDEGLRLRHLVSTGPRPDRDLKSSMAASER